MTQPISKLPTRDDRRATDRVDGLSEDRYRLLVSCVKDYAIFMVSPSGVIQTWNAGAELMKGYRPEEIIGEHISRFYPPDDLAAGHPQQLLDRAARDGRVEEMGWRLRKDGSHFWADVVLTAVHDDGGELIGFTKVTRDLTARRAEDERLLRASEHLRHSEERLRLSEERLRLMVASVQDYAIFMLDPTGRVQTWNAGAQAAKGYQAEEIIGQHMSRFYPPEAAAAGRPQALLARAEREGRVEDLGWRVRKDGTRFWADVVLTAVRDPHGTLIGFTKVTRDLTQQREAEQRLRLSEERLRLMIGSVRDYAIFMLSPSGEVQTWNTGAEAIKGYTAAEIVGAPMSRFYLPEDVAAGKPAALLAKAERDGHAEDEGWRVRKDGSRFWADVVLTVLRDPEGKLVGYTKVTRDLTDRRAAEAERLRLAQTEEALRLRDDFLSIASHELKTPLTALRLQLQSISRKVSTLDPKLAARIAGASRSSERMADLIETLLDVSRISTGRFTLVPAPLDAAALVRELVERFGPQAESAGGTVRDNSPASLPVTWDAIRVEQLLSNLLGNAIKYAAGTPIELSLRAEGTVAVLEVRDHGPGIAEGDLSRIFGRFERAAAANHFGGLGLGLYVAQQIATAHGGELSAENAPGGGARFRVRLPLIAHVHAPALCAPGSPPTVAE